MSRPGEISSILDQQRLARVRRRRVRASWLNFRPFLLLLAAAIAVGLGYWGFHRVSATRNGDPADLLYRSVRLFGFIGGDVNPPVPWQLQIARTLAPLLVGYAAIGGLVALFREQALLLRLRLFARRHIVVVGLGETGYRLATRLAESRLKVVVIERDRAHSALAGCRTRPHSGGVR